MLILSHHAVDNSLSQLDKQYITKYLVEALSLPEKSTYENEVDFITSVQHVVLKIAPGNEGIPFGKKESRKNYMKRRQACVLIELGLLKNTSIFWF